MQSHYIILQKLSDARFHSGESLGLELGLSRSAVWKCINTLKKKGIEVFSVRGRGYRLATPLEYLDRERIVGAMEVRAASMLRQLDIIGEVDSTNRYLAREPKQLCGHACLAEYQTQGQGRQGRTWVSPFGKNIYLSLGWVFSGGPATLAGLSLAVGVAVARGMLQLGVQGVRLKWPNDVYWQDRKLGGILLEMSGESSGPSKVIVGLGVNLDMGAHAGRSIDQAWTDLSAIIGREHFSRNHVAAILLQQLLLAMDEFSRHGLSAFLEEWCSLDRIAGQQIQLQMPGKTIMGMAKGVDEHGALLVETDSGIQRYMSGEVTIRVCT